MREFLEFLFHFRNAGHERWFVMSMAMFVMSLSMNIIGRKIFKQSTRFVNMWMALYHFFVVAGSFLTVVVAHRPSEIYSIDCIWFNSLMVAIYIIMGMIFNKKVGDKTKGGTL